MTELNGIKPVLDADLLTPFDLIEARKALPDMDVAAMLTDTILMIPLTVFCLRRRDNPDFTWDQALHTPMSEFNKPEPTDPPPTLPLASSGKSVTTPSVNGSNAKPAKPATERSSATSLH